MDRPVDLFARRLFELREQRGWSLRELAKRYHGSSSQVQDFETGRKIPIRHTLKRIDDALGADGELVAILYPPDVGHQTARKASVAMAWPGTAFDHRTVTTDDVEAVRTFTATFRALDNQFGGGHAYTVAAHYLDAVVAVMLRDGSYTDRVGRDLFRAAAQLAHLVGWTAYDLGHHDRARTAFDRALELATGGHDAEFGAEILAAKGHHAIHLGEPKAAVELARAGQRGELAAGMLVLRAEALALEANGRALLGDRRGSLAALRGAERDFERAPSQLPEWLAYFDDGYLAARVAHTLRDLGEWDEAQQHAHRALSMSPAMTRTLAFNTAMLATAYVETDLEQAFHTGAEALGLAAKLRSSRAVRYVADLRSRLIRRHPGEKRTAEFSDRYREALGDLD